MDRAARVKSWSAVWLLLGLLVPALFLLDFCVQRSGAREVWLTSELTVQLDGQDPLLLAAHMEGTVAAQGLEVQGSDVLRQDRYPWRPIPVEGTFMLRLDREFLSTTEAGVRRAGFGASYKAREVDRADGYGTPEIPCKGEVDIIELELDPGAESMEGLRSAQLHVDLVCTSAGPDLEWRTGDERGWVIEGPLTLTTGRLR